MLCAVKMMMSVMTMICDDEMMVDHWCNVSIVREALKLWDSLCGIGERGGEVRR